MLKNATFFASVEEALNIQDANLENLKVFPNHVADYVSIKMLNSESDLRIAVFNEFG